MCCGVWISPSFRRVNEKDSKASTTRSSIRHVRGGKAVQWMDGPSGAFSRKGVALKENPTLSRLSSVKQVEIEIGAYNR